MDKPQEDGVMRTPLIEETCAELRRLLADQAEQLKPEVRQEILRITSGFTPANLLESYGRLNATPALSMCFGQAVANLAPGMRTSLKAHLRLAFVRQMQRFEVTGLHPELAQTLQGMKRLRGLCPSAEEIVEYEELQPADRRKHRIHPHVRLCSRCRLLLLNMAEPSGWDKHFQALFGQC